MKISPSQGKVSAKVGIKLKKQSPPLPKRFEKSPLFANDKTALHFRM